VRGRVNWRLFSVEDAAVVVRPRIVVEVPGYSSRGNFAAITIAISAPPATVQRLVERCQRTRSDSRTSRSLLLGHSSTRVTQDIYIHVNDDLFDRFYNATSAGEERHPSG
jgi:hypothetical protein